MSATQAEQSQRLKDNDTTLRSVSEKIREAADQRDEQACSAVLNPNPNRLVGVNLFLSFLRILLQETLISELRKRVDKSTRCQSDLTAGQASLGDRMIKLENDQLEGGAERVAQ